VLAAASQRTKNIRLTSRQRHQHEIFHHDRFLLQSTGLIPHAQMLRSIELFGTKVAPEVRKALRAGLTANQP
jgi:hypothetical protein